MLENERNRYRNHRPSLRGYWVAYLREDNDGRLFTQHEVEGLHVYRDNEKGPKSLYGYYQPTGNLEEQKMEQFWLNKVNKEVAEKRETEEFVHFMKDWASAKQRHETELIRKNGQAYSGSSFEKRAFRLTSKQAVQK